MCSTAWAADLRARPALAHQLVDLGGPQPGDRELGRDEHAVGRDQREGEQQLSGHRRSRSEAVCHRSGARGRRGGTSTRRASRLAVTGANASVYPPWTVM